MQGREDVRWRLARVRGEGCGAVHGQGAIRPFPPGEPKPPRRQGDGLTGVRVWVGDGKHGKGRYRAGRHPSSQAACL